MKNLRLLLTLLGLLVFFTGNVLAQVGINIDNSTPDAAAMLDVKSDTKGLLPPRMTFIQMNAIPAPPAGLMVYNTTDNALYWFNGAVWKKFSEPLTETDPVFSSHPAANVTGISIINWNTAFGWGNHAGLYRPIGWVPSWAEVTGKPSFAAVATSGDYNDLINKPLIINSQWTTSGVDIYYNTGNVGIGTTNPVGKLNVNQGSVLFSGTNGVTPISGAGTRLMWVPEKKALRAGLVTSTQWDADSIGTYSMALGYNTVATGLGSFAGGYGAAARGENGSVALGYYSKSYDNSGNIAMGYYSRVSGGSGCISLGYYAESSGTSGSIAAGNHAISSGYSSVATGRYTTSSGNSSFAANYYTTAKGSNTFALGTYTTAKSYGSLVIGRYNVMAGDSANWVDTDPLFVVGNGTAANAPSNALTLLKNGNLGINTTNPTAKLEVYEGSVLFGGGVAETPVSGSGGRFMYVPVKRAIRAGFVSGTQWDHDSIGSYSAAFGYNTKAIGSRSFAIGYGSEAIGAYGCIAGGYESKALQDYSIALGRSNTSSGTGSLALGYQTTASGNYAATMGFSTTAQSYLSLAVGRYNTLSGSTSSWVSTDPLFVVGNGTSDGSRSNAFTLLKDGRTGVGITPAYMLDIENSGFTRGLNINNTYSGSSTKYGIYNNISEDGTQYRYGIYNYVTSNSSSTWASYGLYNHMNSNSAEGNVFGIYSFVSATGTGDKYALYASASGGWAGYFSAGNVYIGGNLSIGTTTVPAGYKVAVDGKLICEEIKVQLSASWPDYVFDQQYPLLPLNRLEQVIQKQKHLPELPPAEEIDKNGLDVGDMTARLTRKIEELTLYLIDLNRKVEKLEKENQALKSMMLNPKDK